LSQRIGVFNKWRRFGAPPKRLVWIRHCPQVNIHCIANFFTVHDLRATCTCPEKTELPWKFSLYWIHFLPFRIFQQLCACPEKHSCFAFTVLNIFFTFRIFEQLAHALKIEYTFYHSGFLSNFALALKNRVCPEIFHCIECIFYIQDILAPCACPEKQSVPWKFSLYWIHFLPFRIFKQLCACPENTVALQSLYWIYFLHSGCLSNLRMPWNFSLNWMCFLYSGFLSSLRWNFSSPGGRSPPPNPNPRLCARLQISARYCHSQKILHPWLKHNAPIQRLRKRTLVSTRNISS